jgi:hypothetical protein
MDLHLPFLGECSVHLPIYQEWECIIREDVLIFQIWKQCIFVNGYFPPYEYNLKDELEVM